MEDFPYSPQSVAEPYRAIFEQLASCFPAYEVWQRHEDFHRWLSAGVVNRSTGVAVTVTLVRGGHARTQLITAEELARIRTHLESERAEDLAL